MRLFALSHFSRSGRISRQALTGRIRWRPRRDPVDQLIAQCVSIHGQFLTSTKPPGHSSTETRVDSLLVRRSISVPAVSFFHPKHLPHESIPEDWDRLRKTARETGSTNNRAPNQRVRTAGDWDVGDLWEDLGSQRTPAGTSECQRERSDFSRSRDEVVIGRQGLRPDEAEAPLSTGLTWMRSLVRIQSGPTISLDSTLSRLVPPIIPPAFPSHVNQLRAAVRHACARAA